MEKCFIQWLMSELARTSVSFPGVEDAMDQVSHTVAAEKRLPMIQMRFVVTRQTSEKLACSHLALNV